MKPTETICRKLARCDPHELHQVVPLPRQAPRLTPDPPAVEVLYARRRLPPSASHPVIAAR